MKTRDIARTVPLSAGQEVTLVRMCRTEYKGPTDHHGGRVVATHVNTKKRIVRPWDHALGILENHSRAAAELLGSDQLWASSIDGGGYMFACLPTEQR